MVLGRAWLSSGPLLPLLLLLLLLVPPALGQHSVLLDGDLVLGGLFPVHEKGDGTPCSAKLYNRGLQRLEAMLFAVDRINSDRRLLPHTTIGVNILDTCSTDTYALNQSLAFIKAPLDVMDTVAFECADRSTPRPKYRSKAVSGVVGGSYSTISINVANLFRLFRIPQISPASTAQALSDKSRFEFFARTVPPDTFQATALVDMVQLFNWSYVSTIASEGSYGESGMDAFHRQAAERNICIAVTEKVPRDATAKTFENIIMNLQKKPMARGVILFVRAEDARGVLEAAKRLRLREPFHWIASDGWGKQESLVQGVEEVAEGAITVELTSRRVAAFDRYMAELTPDTNRRNPWFRDYWQAFFGCSLEPDAAEDTACDSALRLRPETGFVQESKVQFVIDAVYAFAHALEVLQLDVCGSNRYVCANMRRYDGGDFYKKYLLNVSFTDIAGSKVQFDARGDGLARYTIFNFQRVANGQHQYKVIGQWGQGELNMSRGEVQWNGGTDPDRPPPRPSQSPSDGRDLTPLTPTDPDGDLWVTDLTPVEVSVPLSVCALPCGVGEVKLMQQGDTCCWMCDKCEPFEFMKDEHTCEDCGHGRWPYPDKLSCYDLEVQYMKWTSPLAIGPIAIAVIGIVLTVAVILVFLRRDDTPIVKASGRELSYMLLAGILICYLNTFLLLTKPSPAACALQRVGVGLGFAFIYSALFTKTNRISRIFDSASRSAKRPSFISPKSQIVITTLLISVQLLATAVWLLVELPGVRYDYPDRGQVILKCRIKDSSFLVSLVYNMVLIVVCTVYAVKARKVPENFNETKFIAFTMYTTCIIWLAFVPIYFGTGNSFEVQITTLCVAISLSASVALICLYAPKVYIIVFHPEKNVRKLTMNSAAYRRAVSSSAAPSFNHALAMTEVVKLQGSSAAGSQATATSVVPQEDGDHRQRPNNTAPL
ncbi:metabotropic glutamate receptor-like [Amphibalanus amphitrite]|uniref:metabotropic glutamate receptor-like n=1 Tax=Amphibalanus amphitrite TaxID=1232801 RepID=UPI001C90C914|nr:metabotropic glutamate receptor-like [Amphibalanus amphitrite]XP_043238838.1 metabotropic glutamate receptor-like [Amphibalanus amphitrite]